MYVAFTPPVKSLETEEVATEEIGTQRKLKRKTQSCSQPTRKSFSLFRVRPRLTLDQDANEVIDLSHLNEEERIGATENLRDILDFEEGAGMHTAEEKNPIENFDDYLGTLEDILAMPHTDITPSDHVTPVTSMDNKMECCKKKLSSFLAVDFLSLVSCNDDVVEVVTLASQLRKDPNLSVDQLTKLKLVEQIPLLSDAFLEAKGNIKEADKLLADLEEKKFKISSLKIEYIELKDKVTRREDEMDELALNIQEIDDQMQQLQSKRIEKSGTLETVQKSKAELTTRLANTTNSIPTLVHEIQLGLSQISKWEQEKANNAKRIAEIEEKFITLRGSTF